ncbi:hypothetical protein CEXT_542081 [Caerostris extrusa]|uniref:Uncharacterized protein n=1 Tax=Caerostris extrusa TaxID=172846 RepID=A0AAV4PIH7_CAEEX|nr:hypothetical protein CEXT_542081 [Caerostris extrusa]
MKVLGDFKHKKVELPPHNQVFFIVILDNHSNLKRHTRHLHPALHTIVLRITTTATPPPHQKTPIKLSHAFNGLRLTLGPKNTPVSAL